MLGPFEKLCDVADNNEKSKACRMEVESIMFEFDQTFARLLYDFSFILFIQVLFDFCPTFVRRWPNECRAEVIDFWNAIVALGVSPWFHMKFADAQNVT